MISSEYGWSDETVKSLPICRVRQIVEHIRETKTDLAQLEMRMVEWSTKVLASFMVNTAQVTEKGHKSLMSAVQGLRLSTSDDESDDSVDNRDIEDIIENGAIYGDDRLVAGSAEMFTGIASGNQRG